MPLLRGRVSSVSWRDDFTGETVARIAPEGANPGRLSYAFHGHFAHGFVTGEVVEVVGDWDQHRAHGRIFKVSKIERRPPTTREGAEVFLCGYIKGLTKGQAKLLLDKYQSIDGIAVVARSRPQEFSDLFPKARKTVARLRSASWDRKEINLDAHTMLASAGLRPTQTNALVRFFGASAIATIAQNSPYDFCQVPKVGFKTAEKVAEFYAREQGRPKDIYSQERLVYGLCDVVANVRQDGHVCAPEELILRKALRHLGFDRSQWDEALPKLREALTQALARRLLIKDYDKIYPRGLHRAEVELALHIGKLMVGGAKPLFLSKTAILKELVAEEAKPGGPRKLSDEQKEAVATCGTVPVSCLIGGPGRGKTATLARLVGLLDKTRRSYMLLAPTGKAAKRAAEATGKPCQTIHKACGLDREEDVHAKRYGKKLGRRDRFSVDVVIVDETSMVDLALGFELVRRCKPGRTALILVGDPDQLPPVGAGQLLKDVLSSGAIPVAKLSQVFRQANGSPIVDVADQMNRGDAPAFPTDGYEVRLFDPTTAKGHPGDTDEARAAAFETPVLKKWLVQALKRYAADLSIDPVRDIQVYAPQRSGDLGIEAVNRLMQAEFNAHAKHNRGPVVKIDGGFQVFVGDKVMQTTNNYRLRLASASEDVKALGRQGRLPETEAQKNCLVSAMNGQVGFVMAVNPSEVHVKYDDYDSPVVYLRSDEWRQLTLSYCMSIHKSQGSETPYAFILLSGNSRMVNRPLIYTAWTRCKKGGAIFASRRQVLRACQNLEGTDRHSNLAPRLRQVCTPRAGPRKKLVIAGPAAGPANGPAPEPIAAPKPTGT